MPPENPPLTAEDARAIALSLPEAEEGKSYGTAAFRVGKKFFARLREDGETLVVKVDLDEREVLLQAHPEAFFITDHYQGYPLMLVRLPAVSRDELRERLEESWRRSAPARLVAAQPSLSK